MLIKGAKTIAEYAIRRWMLEQNFIMELFELSVNGNEGVITDKCGDSLAVVYDPETKSVHVKEGDDKDA